MPVITALIFMFLSWQITPAKGQCSEENWDSFGKQEQVTQSKCSEDAFVAGLRSENSFFYSWGELAVVSKAKCCKVMPNESDCLEQELKW